MHDELSPELFDALHEAEDLKIAGKYQEAITLLEQIIIHNPQCSEAFEELADNEVSLGEYVRAKKAALAALSLNPQSGSSLYILGFVSSHEMKWEESISYLQKANRLEPNDAEILRCLGWSVFMNGDQISGLVTLERALNLDTHNVYILCDLGVVHLQLDHLEKARSLFQHALKIDPENMRTLECLRMVDELSTPSKKKRKPKAPSDS
jgi:tetratricopeptide (TPR) repeat protein